MTQNPLEALDKELDASLEKAEQAETALAHAATTVGDAAESEDWERLRTATLDLTDAEIAFWETEN